MLTEFLTDIVTQHVKSCHAEFLPGFIQLALHADFPVFLTLIADGRERLLVEVILLAKRADPLLRDSSHPFAGDRKGLYRLLCLFRAFWTRKQIRFNKRFRIIDIKNIRRFSFSLKQRSGNPVF